jgi:anti-sigma B factor antagonist
VSELDDAGFEVSQHSVDGSLTVTLTGELDVASAPVLQNYVSNLRPLVIPLKLDVSRLSFVDSSGLRTLVAARRAAVEDTGQPATLVGATDMLRKLLAMSGLATAFGLDE